MDQSLYFTLLHFNVPSVYSVNLPFLIWCWFGLIWCCIDAALMLIWFDLVWLILLSSLTSILELNLWLWFSCLNFNSNVYLSTLTLMSLSFLQLCSLFVISDINALVLSSFLMLLTHLQFWCFCLIFSLILTSLLGLGSNSIMMLLSCSQLWYFSRNFDLNNSVQS